MQKQLFYHESDLFPYEPISPILMVIYSLSSFWFFTILNQTIKRRNIDKTNWLKHNILLSCIHAAICSVLLTISVLREPNIFQDPLSHSNHFNYALVAFTTGYFLYDLIDCIQNSTSSTIAFLIHHILVMIFFIHVLFHTRNLGYAVYGLSIEINSFFLHARRLFRWYSPILTSTYLNNLLQICIDIGNYVTFILFRFGIVIVGLRALYIQRNRLNPIVHAFTVIITAAMGILNIVLFYRLVKGHFMRKLKVKQIEDQSLTINNPILLPS
ncbi:unnamed protein product [Rotaria socialis]|uniref:TLC domain-containing protein n=1 Tax=Rotaria socialis TaxID=392032 RepID=A0A817PJD9_9BILA|nr:unnamed protein product [Rotaria socialis]CAF3306366.1 unnamed protein product [Rotaria socialis]CAF3507803.1 unnamed protein product [Rotaria socialis]CAF3579006.1 unnamed protein product [Rotaria socialis]CAF4289079.1 unnamed protein product [Rotaria socialis]